MSNKIMAALMLCALMGNLAVTNICMANDSNTSKVSTAAKAGKGNTVLGNKKINPYELFQIQDAATCLEDILGGKK